MTQDLSGSGYNTGRLPQSTVNNQRFSAAEPIDNQVIFSISIWIFYRTLQIALFQEENQNMAAPNVDEIRKRLAKIKAQAF